MKYIFGNWKLNKTPRETESYLEEWNDDLVPVSKVEVAFFPPATSLERFSRYRRENRQEKIRFGGQNCGTETTGALTGEISAAVLKEIGAKYVLLGHSERRTIFGETNAMIAKKVSTAIREDVTPVVCIGETREQREKNQTKEVLKAQIQECLGQLAPDCHVVVAYEPVWAIGTGLTATEPVIHETHTMIRSLLKPSWPLVYGGSVDPDNAGSILKIQNVDGLLVGRASLDPVYFLQIVKSV